MRPSALRRITPPKRAYTTPSPSPSPTSASAAAARLLETFHGKTLIQHQVLDANQLQKLSLTLNRPTIHAQNILTSPPAPGTPIPPGHHLVYFTPGGLESALGPDGTDRTFNAPAPFTRRMWAGGHMSWTASPLRVGDPVSEHTRLLSAAAKTSKSSGDEMVLVEVEKELRGPRGAGLVDTRSWIFRTDIRVGSPPEPLPPAQASLPTAITDIPGQRGFPARQLTWSAVGLFRFSALTFNGHKIHYDAGWSRGVEGHAGVVVHGPLNLINMLDYWGDVHGAGTAPASVAYRAVAPLYAGDTYTIQTGDVRDGVYDVVADKDGTVCMKAQIVATSHGP
ncbi:hypothetical protein X797_012008 [Metarhizium robertsii]|uniref:C6 transcription factor n=2 Tax=Metarhizium robertsii TaxID=568076 RepID=E9FDW4_METRA|nr:C6 transcription factor [Metarhizium robertsii ARSEF 23]EFY94075.1 C6 transcription factor [Metarhizium robertsii ARSEF 23]EXU94908.1 hypothetical protein X797_012008 [Metarhizium robertsii]